TGLLVAAGQVGVHRWQQRRVRRADIQVGRTTCIHRLVEQRVVVPGERDGFVDGQGGRRLRVRGLRNESKRCQGQDKTHVGKVLFGGSDWSTRRATRVFQDSAVL